MKDFHQLIFSDNIPFEENALQVFQYQFDNNPVYRRYCEAMDSDILSRTSWDQDDIDKIPFLPIKAFKDAVVSTEPDTDAELIFKSSGTSGVQRSLHRVMDKKLYEQSILKGFQQFYDLDDAVIWGYAPGYAENPHSSLIYMLQTLIDQDNSGLSRFLPLDEPLNPGAVKEVARQKKQLILFGAAFGLLDLLDMQQTTLPSNSVVIETGGMKTHRREITRRELHKRLASGFGLNGSRIHSEYGMAELLSQAYATGGQWFRTLPWMRVSVRNPDDPAEKLPPNTEGIIAIIDLANVHSCSFLLTADKGTMDSKGRFKVLGRWNPKDLRGCNFLIEED